MLTKFISRIVDVCLRFPRSVVVLGLLIAIASGVYAARHFAITSDIDSLLSKDLPWRKRGIVFEDAFKRFQIIDVVLEAPTPELAAAATDALTSALKRDKTHFKTVTNSSAADFFARNGLLFVPEGQLKESLDGIVKGAPLLTDLGQDPSLRGLVSVIEDTLIGVNQQKIELNATAPVFKKGADTVQDILAGKPASFSWRALVEGRAPMPLELRGFIEVRPVLDYKSLEPGQEATQALRAIAAQVAPKYQATCAADRACADVRRGIRHHQGERRAQRCDHPRHRPVHLVAGAALAQIDRSRCSSICSSACRSPRRSACF